MNLEDLPIARKLRGAILVLLVTTLAVFGITLQHARTIERESAADITSARTLSEKVALWRELTETAVARGTAVAASSDANVREFFRKTGDSDAKHIGKLRTELTELAKTDADQAAMQRAAELGKALLAASTASTGDAAKAQRDYAKAAADYLGAIDAFGAVQQRKVDEALKKATAAQARTLVIGGIGALLIIGLGVVVSTALLRLIRTPLERSIRVAKAMAEGDLTQRIGTERKDELGQLMRALQHMNESLGRVVGNVRASTDSIGTASTEIASGNADLSSRTEQAASNLQETASSMEQLTGTVRQSADSARQANQLASSAAAVAARGGSVVSQVVITMDEINASSKKISDIIGVIDGIAFQTNILALNAAVEAARAGEQGRGFAVVASEVRSLAQRSAQAAREIKALISTSVEKVEGGSRLVADAGNTMQEIVGSVQRVTDIIGEITAAAAEQSDGIGQVNTAVNQLDQMTQQNAALVEQSAAAAQSLKDQAKRLAQVISVFKL